MDNRTEKEHQECKQNINAQFLEVKDNIKDLYDKREQDRNERTKWNTALITLMGGTLLAFLAKLIFEILTRGN